MENFLKTFLFLLFGIGGTYSFGRPHAVWKDETDWGGGSWGEHVGPPRRGPHFLPGLPSNVSVTIGRTATLPCQVANLRGRSVSWIRQSDLQVLTTDKNVFTSDDRFKVLARRISGVWSWDLIISETQENDDGTYECQINTRPKLSHPVLLQVVQAGAVIAGPTEVYVHTGSRLLLTCWVHAPPKPPGPLVWYHNGTILDSLTPRGGLSLHVAVEGARASTRLSLLHVKPGDAGNYTCQPEGLDASTVNVFVLQDEAPAAMHHDNGCSCIKSSINNIFIVLMLAFLFTNSIYFQINSWTFINIIFVFSLESFQIFNNLSLYQSSFTSIFKLNFGLKSAIAQSITSNNFTINYNHIILKFNKSSDFVAKNR